MKPADLAAIEKTASPKAILIIFLSHLNLVLLSFFIRCPFRKLEISAVGLISPVQV
jgi:hypothetical protein